MNQELKQKINEPCSNALLCDDTEGLVCSTFLNNSTSCQCYSAMYHNGTTCGNLSLI